MKKVLMLASVASMIDQFNMPNLNILKNLGYDVHVAANFKSGNTSSPDRIKKFKAELLESEVPSHHIDFSRRVTNITSNFSAYIQLKKIIKKNQYDFIHCHSPIGGVIGRILGKRMNIPVIYTAHGFHFYKGASIFSWLIYYPIEKVLSKWTEILITINKEDYKIAQKFNARHVKYLPGVGVDINKYSNNRPVDTAGIRAELEIPNNAFVVLSIGELNENKNHRVMIEAISRLNNPNLFYLICGEGPLKSELKKLAIKLGVESHIKFLGFRQDVAVILQVADVFGFPSQREGLSLSLMEAMSSELPIVCSNIRGNKDLVKDNLGGILLEAQDIEGFKKALNDLYNDENQRIRMGKYNKKVVSKFGISNISREMKKIYIEV